MNLDRWKMPLRLAAVAAVVAVLGAATWNALRPRGPGAGFVSGNGRIEAVEIDIAAKTPGRLRDLLVEEGEFVNTGQPLARMDTDVLQAQRDEAAAQLAQARAAIQTAQFQVAQRQSEHAAAQATAAAQAAELDAARKRYARTRTLAERGSISQQELDDARAAVDGRAATAAAARAQITAAAAAIETARSQVLSAQSAADAATATIARIDADLLDSTLKSPRDGRVQYRVAQPGEVLGAGGNVLNLVDLGEVYMTFFLPETVAGRVALGSEVHIVLDAAPQYVIPASVSFVAAVAQFTPKTVETASERQKLMFRVKAQIDRGLLQKHLRQVKTGLPGVAWVRLDPAAPWPADLAVKVPE
jgi:HlyD family secretion protein